MRVSKLDRRDFIEAMLLVGLSACGGPSWGRKALRSSQSADSAMGPFYRSMARLSDDLVGGRIDGREYVHRIGARLMELELERDVLESWSASGPDERGAGRNGFRTIHSRPLRVGSRPGATKAILFFSPPHTSHPPHEHHNLMSCKRVLKGSYHVRQYERVGRVEPGVIAVRQVSELLDVDFGGPYIDMTDDRLNVHWFGAGAEPVLALNINVEDALAPADTFHGAGEARRTGPHFVDVTGSPDRDGLILAPAMSRERAEELALRPLSDFPSRVAAATPA